MHYIIEMNNMEWNYLGSPSQADGKQCVHIIFIYLERFSESVQIT